VVRFFKWLVGVVLVVAAVVVAVGFALPAGYAVERSVVIDAPRERVHALVADLEQWPRWQPWQDEDPTIEITIGEKSAGFGATQSWSGESGSGEHTFTLSDQDRGIVYDLSIEGGTWSAVGAVSYEVVPGNDAATRVVWTMTGDNSESFIGRYFNLAVDAMVGPMFERGLAKLEQAAEAGG
jgi:uncharacterized membrane protein